LGAKRPTPIKTFVEKEEKPDKEFLDKVGNGFFQRLADFLNEKKTTILNLVTSKVYDKVLNAREYQLLKYKHLFQILVNNHFPVSEDERKVVRWIIPQFFDNTMELNALLSTLSKFGNYELFPKSSKFINYKSKLNL